MIMRLIRSLFTPRVAEEPTIKIRIRHVLEPTDAGESEELIKNQRDYPISRLKVYNIETEPRPESPPYDISAEPILGVVQNECPTCRCRLAKRPQRKTKCKECGEFIFVKMRPQDRERVLVTEADRDRIEALWSRLQSPNLTPAYVEALTGFWTRERVQFLKHSDWSRYRNSLLDEGKTIGGERALRCLLAMLYLDANGADSPGFDIEMRFFADGALAFTAITAEDSEISPANVKRMFLEEASRLHTLSHAPLAPATALKKVWPKLFGLL